MREFEGVEPWTPEVARRRLSEFEASGLSAAVYAARLGVSRQRVSYWWARLRREAAEARPRFVELAVRERAPPPAVLKVRFPSGHAVIVPAGTATLAEVLALVEGLRC
jgi:hypothetical protein